MKTLTILLVTTLLSINLIAQIDEQHIDEQIATLENRIIVKIEQFGDSSLEARDAFHDLRLFLKEHCSDYEAGKTVIYLIFYMSMLNMMKCLQLLKNVWIFV